uniref:RING-type domain-containing protein n=1 Tax=Ananas comosus var. bracteatus TaxID=296719 RepID=A0A6V7NWU8_ANACO|nr:unnamed protein product [Ananas comosus var. bracteatus]
MALVLFGVAARIMIVSSIITAAVPLAAVGVLVVLQALTVCRAFKGLLRSASTIESHGGRSHKGLSSEELERLPRFNFCEAQNIKESVLTNCTICLDVFQIGDICKLLPSCGHSFHTHCVDNWLLMNPICPLCRTSVAAAAAHRRSTASAVQIGI